MDRSVVERLSRDWRTAGSSPRRSGGRIVSWGVNSLCWLLPRYPFHPGHCGSNSTWQILVILPKVHVAGYMCATSNTMTLWSGAWLYGVHRKCAEIAVVLRGTLAMFQTNSVVSTPLWRISKFKTNKQTTTTAATATQEEEQQKQKQQQQQQQQPNGRLRILKSCFLFTPYKAENNEGGGG